MAIFNSYVSLPEGKNRCSNQPPLRISQPCLVTPRHRAPRFSQFSIGRTTVPFSLVDSQFFCWWTLSQKTRRIVHRLLVKTCQNPMFVAKNQMCSMRCPSLPSLPHFSVVNSHLFRAQKKFGHNSSAVSAKRSCCASWHRGVQAEVLRWCSGDDWDFFWRTIRIYPLVI